MNLRLRRAVLADARMALTWRNHPLARAASTDTREIAWDAHLEWFNRSLAREDRIILIAEDNAVPVGVLRLDRDEHVAEVSVFLDPGLTGKGYGTAVLRTGIEWAQANCTDIRTLRARVRSANASSLRAFEKAGFEETWRILEMNL
jgi:RimJ/RimL family protein N-acetyltransferase